MRRLTLLVILLVPLLASCGSNGKEARRGTSAAQSTLRSASGQPTKNCPTLRAIDVAHVASIRPLRQQTLANLPGSHLHCSSLFIDSSGQLILEFTEAGGGRAALATLRRVTGEEQGRATVR